MLPIEAINATALNFVHKRLLGAAKGFLGGGPLGAARGFVGGGGGDARSVKQMGAGGGGDRFTSGPDTGGCGPGNAPTVSSGCVPYAKGLRRGIAAPVQALARNGLPFQLPETPNITTPAEGEFQAVAGAFGMPAIAPKHELVGKFVCPTGMVLGRDELCYPRQVLRRDSRFRKWSPGVRPILTGGQRNSIRKARAAITTAKDSISGLGLTVKKN